MLDKLYLSKRNLLTLLSKLDRLKEGDDTFCMIAKFDNIHPAYPQTMRSCLVKSLEDTDWHPGNTSDKVYLHRKDLNLLLKRLEDSIVLPVIIEKCGVSGSILITAVSDEEYYKDRVPGEVHPKDIK